MRKPFIWVLIRRIRILNFRFFKRRNYIMFQLGQLLTAILRIIVVPFIGLYYFFAAIGQLAFFLASIPSLLLTLVSSAIVLLRSRSSGLFLASIADALAAESGRRSFIERSLLTDRQIKIRETPPLFETPEGPRRLSNAEASAQEIRLRYQKERETVLFGRAGDALQTLSEFATRSGETSLEYSLSLRKLSFWERRQGYLDWVVTIATPHRELIEGHLLRLKEWLGIGVEFGAYSPATLHRACRDTPEEMGTIAGGVKTVSDLLYALTCKHVLPRCDHDIFPTLSPGADIPDATLINMHDGCFAGHFGSALPIVEQSFLSDLYAEGRYVTRLGGASPVEGYVENRVSEYTIDGTLYSFPACTVAVRRRRILGLFVYPRTSKGFSKKGDSGSWVVAGLGGKNSFLGLIHGGTERFSYVILAEPLFEFLNDRLAAINPGERISNVIPFEDR
ncbi:MULTISPECIES: hypothetical protein [Rhizobium]|uniref:Uncharacterized protein n=1 Tax=Rhizobium ruizarguesonis TaxID=2081791 RepID=A0AAE8QD35_9HYPH|nr:hypothetical protein [Rhizobium ruizarguesonis]TBD09921.1 hypothetical protein ELH23_33525 [Rhizobium ruizarguesonis]TBF19001.1 hypothetical protein ELG94_12095 [Rhizobium ruizarguesonis]